MTNNNKGKMRPSDRRRGRPQSQGNGSSGANRGRSQGDQRASAKRNYERYVELARAAISAGDEVEGEYFYQHAEHYYRTMRERDGVA